MNTLTNSSIVGRIRSAVDAAEAATRDYGAFVTVLRERALAEAAVLDDEPQHGPMHGVPVAVKDNIDVAGTWTRCGTPGYGHHRAERDATVVARLRAAGAVVIGKTRMHELAWGMTTPGCRNPRDPERITGGSSGGSAAAVAAGVVPIALGTDTGGSVRNPAALCGVVGMKTATGSLPLDGVSPLAPSQDTVGVLAADTDWCRTALKALDVAGGSAPPLRVGLLTERWAQRVEPELTTAIGEAADQLRATSVQAEPLEVPRSELAAATSYVTMLAEAARTWWDEESPPPPGALGQNTRKLLLTGRRVTESDHATALAIGSAFRRELARVFKRVDALLLATCPVGAAPIGAEAVRCAGRDIPIETAHSALTSLASVSGLPAASLPTVDRNGTPIGVQLIGPDTDVLCTLGDTLQACPHDYRECRPQEQNG